MTKGRSEAFTDGVVAIVISILVLDIKFTTTPSNSCPLWNEEYILSLCSYFYFCNMGIPSSIVSSGR